VVVQRKVARQPFHSRTVGVHGVNFQVAVALGDERDPPAVWREGRVVVERRVFSKAEASVGLDIGCIKVQPRGASEEKAIVPDGS
jgi:hypothetical protein